MQNNFPAIILAVDPGYDRCGLAVFSAEKELLHSACIVTNAKDRHADRLRYIRVELEKIMKEWKPDLLAIETLFFSLNKKTAIKVAEARGVILCTAAESGIEIIELSPQLIKLSTTGIGNSAKQGVQKMVATILKQDLSAKLDDEIDAMAIGLAALEELRVQQLFTR